MRDVLMRIGGAFGLAVLLSGIAAPGFAQPSVDCDAGGETSGAGPTIVILYPNPGDVVAPGGQSIRGAAFDCDADVGIGVDRVSVYLGSREAGGTHLGDATLGGPSGVNVVPASQFGSAGWTLSMPTSFPVAGQGQTLSVYAHSTVNGKVTRLAIPVIITTSAPAVAPPAPASQATEPANTPLGNPSDTAAPPTDVQTASSGDGEDQPPPE